MLVVKIYNILTILFSLKKPNRSKTYTSTEWAGKDYRNQWRGGYTPPLYPSIGTHIKIDSYSNEGAEQDM